MTNAIEYLKAHPFFTPFSVPELVTLLRHSNVRHTPAGRTLADPLGTPVMLLMLRGQAECGSVNSSRTLRVGDMARSATAGTSSIGSFSLAATSDTSHLELSPVGLAALRRDDPGLARVLMQRLTQFANGPTPTGPVWSGRRPFVHRPPRPSAPSRPRQLLYSFVQHVSTELFERPGTLIATI